MKKENIAILKRLAILGSIVLASVAAIKGCKDALESMGDKPEIDPEISQDQKMTLIDKGDSFYYFDTDGDKYTTEVIAQIRGKPCCFNQVGKMHDAKLDKTQSLKDWKKELFCHLCGKRGRWKIQKVGKEIGVWE